MMSHAVGLLRRSTNQPFDDVIAAAETAIRQSGAAVLARIDHGREAAAVGLELRPTVLLMFGNPSGGTRVMQILPESAIDLPMKLLIQAGDDDRPVQIIGEDPAWIVERHGGGQDLADVVAAMRHLMQQVLAMAAQAGSTDRSA